MHSQQGGSKDTCACPPRPETLHYFQVRDKSPGPLRTCPKSLHLSEMLSPSSFPTFFPSPRCDLQASNSPPCARTAHTSCFFQSHTCCSNWVRKPPPYSLNPPAITFVRIISLERAVCPVCCAGVHTGPRKSGHEATEPWVEDWASLVFHEILKLWSDNGRNKVCVGQTLTISICLPKPWVEPYRHHICPPNL